MELYVLIAVVGSVIIALLSVIRYLFVRNDRQSKMILDLYERIAAKDRDEYLQNTGQQPEQPEIEWEQESYYARPKAVIRKPNGEVDR